MRHQQEHRRGGRLLQGLEQGVLRLGHEPVGVVDDHDPAAPLERTEGGLLDHPADRVDLDRPGVAGLDHDDVGVDAPRDPPARPARPAALGNALGPARRGGRLAVQQLGETQGDLPLADAVGTRQHEAWRQAVAGHGLGEQTADRRMALDRTELSRRTPVHVSSAHRPIGPTGCAPCYGTGLPRRSRRLRSPPDQSGRGPRRSTPQGSCQSTRADAATHGHRRFTMRGNGGGGLEETRRDGQRSGRSRPKPPRRRFTMRGNGGGRLEETRRGGQRSGQNRPSRRAMGNIPRGRAEWRGRRDSNSRPPA